MKKLKINAIAEEVFLIRGFDERGCYGHPCDDMCCIGGVEMDKEAHDLIFEHRGLIESRLGAALEDCFEKDWTNDSDCPGGNSIDTREGKHDYCMFHLPDKKGCVLYKLVAEKKLPKRIIPAVCRLYPLTWDEGVLCISEHLEAKCNCLARDNHTQKTLLETQRREIEDIFAVDKAVFSRKR